MGFEGSSAGQWWLDMIDKTLDEGSTFSRIGSRQLAGLLISVWLVIFLCATHISFSRKYYFCVCNWRKLFLLPGFFLHANLLEVLSTLWSFHYSNTDCIYILRLCSLFCPHHTPLICHLAFQGQKQHQMPRWGCRCCCSSLWSGPGYWK